MDKKMAQQVSRQILEENGGKTADKAKVILLEDPALKELQEPLRFVSNNWRDLTPALMSLACQAVGGKPEDTQDAALALSLMNLSFTIWDDVIDNAQSKTFRPTVYGKFGQNIAIIVGGIASAKAFTILNQLQLQEDKQKAIGRLMWELWSKMATVEATSLSIREQGTQSSSKKLWKMKSEAIDLATSLRVGAIIGNGSIDEIEHLFRYGKNLALILALTLDFQVSINLTLELTGKIRNNQLPYCVLWSSERSSNISTELERLRNGQKIDAEALTRFMNAFLGSGIKCHLSKKVNDCRKRGQAALSCMTTEASQSLKALIDAQYLIFSEELDGAFNA